MDFYIVDVFSQGKYTGNQLAVFTGAYQISGEEMQQIAKEINYAETTFIVSKEEIDKGYSVRIFTPNEEVPFAGHPALGTAFILKSEIIRKIILMKFYYTFKEVQYRSLFIMKQMSYG